MVDFISVERKKTEGSFVSVIVPKRYVVVFVIKSTQDYTMGVCLIVRCSPVTREVQNNATFRKFEDFGASMQVHHFKVFLRLLSLFIVQRKENFVRFVGGSNLSMVICLF